MEDWFKRHFRWAHFNQGFLMTNATGPHTKLLSAETCGHPVLRMSIGRQYATPMQRPPKADSTATTGPKVEEDSANGWRLKCKLPNATAKPGTVIRKNMKMIFSNSSWVVIAFAIRVLRSTRQGPVFTSSGQPVCELVLEAAIVIREAPSKRWPRAE